ncbi:hypothetical protein ACFQAT_14940 [Undibacterium arcticum]|uniref:hypothetical protein n=1 Tax=Undibacterium arcticum TaxID=1762892 RepID=UPI0036205CAB
MLDVVGQLIVQETGRVFAGHGNQAQIVQGGDKSIANDAAADGGLTIRCSASRRAVLRQKLVPVRQACRYRFAGRIVQHVACQIMHILRGFPVSRYDYGLIIDMSPESRRQ